MQAILSMENMLMKNIEIFVTPHSGHAASHLAELLGPACKIIQGPRTLARPVKSTTDGSWTWINAPRKEQC